MTSVPIATVLDKGYSMSFLFPMVKVGLSSGVRALFVVYRQKEGRKA